MHQELSPKEWEVAAEVAQGKTNKEIALTSGLSPHGKGLRRERAPEDRIGEPGGPGRVVRQTPVQAAALIPTIRNARKAGL